MNNIILICFLFFFAISCNQKQKNPEKKIKQIPAIDTTAYTLSYLDPIHKRINFKSYDKSLTEYILSDPIRPDSVRKIIYLLPLGNMNPEIEEMIKGEVEYLKRFFQLEVRIMEKVPFSEIKSRKVKTRFVPANDFEYYGKTKGEHVDLKEQIEAKSFMENYIRNNLPDSAVAVLGITEHDLFIQDMNYIFGISYLKNRFGIVSTFRLANDWDASKSNVRKVVTKQIANIFSISNVKDYYCVLNYHDDLNKQRNGVSYISPKALEKLSYSINFDVEKRFMELKEFHIMEQNEEMVRYYDQCLTLMKEKKQEKKN